jgi:hypothetical protein
LIVAQREPARVPGAPLACTGKKQPTEAGQPAPQIAAVFPALHIPANPYRAGRALCTKISLLQARDHSFNLLGLEQRQALAPAAGLRRCGQMHMTI